MQTSIVILLFMLLGALIYYCPDDQPVRYAAVLLFAPYILWKGVQYKDPPLIAFAIGLFVWDLYCIVFRAPVALSSASTDLPDGNRHTALNPWVPPPAGSH